MVTDFHAPMEIRSEGHGRVDPLLGLVGLVKPGGWLTSSCRRPPGDWRL